MILHILLFLVCCGLFYLSGRWIINGLMRVAKFLEWREFVVAFFVITLLTFIAVNWNPEYEVPWFPSSMSLEEIKSYLNEQGVYQPLVVKYFKWLGDFFTGNWGDSLYPDSYYTK